MTRPPRPRTLAALTALTTATTLLALTACGSADGSGGGGDATPDKPVSLRMTVWTGNEDHLAAFDEIADAYIAANPEKVSSITFETLPAGEYSQALTTQIAGGNGPDLAWIYEASGPEFVASGALENLSPAMEATEGYDVDDILPAALKIWSKDGDVYAYPFSSSPFGVIANETMIKEAGQKTPAELIAAGDWTWESMAEMAAATSAATGKGGFYQSGFEDHKAWQYLATMWSGWDAAPWSEDGTTCTFEDPAMVDFMTWLHQIVYTDGAMPQPGVASDFFAGESAMVITQISRVAGLDDSFDWDMVPLPAGPAGTQPVIGQAGVGVLAKGANPAVAADFLTFFTDPTNAAKLAAFFPPPRQSLLTTEVLGAANPRLTAEQLQAVVIDQLPDGVTVPSHVRFAELSDTARIALDGFWSPKADIASVLTSVCSAIDPKLG